ncbi:uncharacterized protein TrAtP1_006002 [Trichoderma atroviride]|uniref:uncharacterized protein n=1 Tax=Hypocrea atroviridis TaxID=63577 RepID=UPI00331BAF3D|nr:hypothetical protein TrAtP1_006002 [Trichoderma atroviride]
MPFAELLISRGASTPTLSRHKCIHISLPTYLQGPPSPKTPAELPLQWLDSDFDLAVLIAPSGVACFCVLPSHKGGVAADEGCGTRECSRAKVFMYILSLFLAPGREAPFPPPYLLPLFRSVPRRQGCGLHSVMERFDVGDEQYWQL